MLEVQNLSVTARNGTQLLKQISFQIEIGEAVGLTGQSGAGKTTLLKALLGILSGGCQVSGGTIQVDGQSLWALSPRKRRELCGTTLGFIPQNPMTAFDPRLKLGRQMEETLRLRTGVSGKEAVEQAEALLAGIVLDTKHFTQRTGGRTFEAAAFLRRAGADTASVQRLFQSDLQDMVTRYDIIRRADLYRENIALSVIPEDGVDRVAAAQAADELLTLKGVQASFVLYRSGEDVLMSARSLGDINVQVILEALGGGGNSTTAGGRVEHGDVSAVKTRLVDAIDAYFEK